MKQKIKHPVALAILATIVSTVAQADFMDDAKGKLTLRNFYFNRNYLGDPVALDKAESWSQAGFLRLQSGYGEGFVGFGLDVSGFAAIRLRGKYDNSGNLPPSSATDRLNDGYARAGATLKMRLSRTELKAGLLEPLVPIAVSDRARVLPQTFQGVLLHSSELQSLELTAGQLRKTSVRASSHHEKIYLGGRPASEQSRYLSFVGADKKWAGYGESAYWFARLDDVYDQHYLGGQFKHNLDGTTQLSATLSYFDSEDSGRRLSGKIDNKAFGVRLGIQQNAHSIFASYQKMSGKTGFPVLFGFTPPAYLLHLTTNIGFWNPGEKSWQVRYGHDFSSMGLPGLTWMSRYTRGSGGSALPSGASEWERDMDIGYTLQGGVLKDLSLLLRFASVRSPNVDFDEVRFIVERHFELF